jgi:ankyrin repeat protein
MVFHGVDLPVVSSLQSHLCTPLTLSYLHGPLLSAGSDQASRTASGATGLHVAANSGSADIIADLLDCSEDLDPDDDGAYNCKCTH